MSEEEIIEKIKTYLDIENDGFSGHLEPETIQGLLDLYNKQKEEIKELNSEFAINTEIHKRDMKIKELEEVNNCLHETNNELYISKDKIREKINYLESQFDEGIEDYNNQFIIDCVGILEDLLED